MPEQDPRDLQRLQADLERVTRDARRLIEQLSADLCEQTRLRETYVLDSPGETRHERTGSDRKTPSVKQNL